MGSMGIVIFILIFDFGSFQQVSVVPLCLHSHFESERILLTTTDHW
jgi:hypothetical protein